MAEGAVTEGWEAREAAGKGLSTDLTDAGQPPSGCFLCLGNVFYFEVILDSRDSWGDSSGRPRGPFSQRTPV